MARLKAPSGIQVQYRLNFIKIAVLLTFAFVVDALQFILSLTGIGEIVSELIGLLADVFLPLAAWMMGVRYGGTQGGQKMLALLGGTVLELVPFLNDLPGYTLEMAALVLLTRSEDIEKAIQKDRKEKAGRREVLNMRTRHARSVAQHRAQETKAAQATASEEEGRAVA